MHGALRTQLLAGFTSGAPGQVNNGVPRQHNPVGGTIEMPAHTLHLVLEVGDLGLQFVQPLLEG